MAEVITGMTLAQYISSIAPGYWKATRNKPDRFPEWPPDCFAITTAVLKKTGCYDQVIRDWPPGLPKQPLEDWVIETTLLGQDWRAYWNGDLDTFPPKIRRRWRMIVSYHSVPVQAINGRTHRALVHALLELGAIADEASYGLGNSEASQSDFMGDQALRYLKSSPGPVHARSSTLCSPAILGHSVFPKARTPQSGLTIRSLSHHLALLETTEVETAWHLAELSQATRQSAHQPLNLLVIPYPELVSPRDFKALPRRANADVEFHETQCLFHYDRSDHPEATDVPQLTLDLLRAAERFVPQVDAVIFPELSLSLAQYEGVIEALESRYLLQKQDLPQLDHATNCPLLIAGIVDLADQKTGLARNYARCELPKLTTRQTLEELGRDDRWKSFEQDKHHRWFLERNQIVRYGLTSQLDPNLKWWEATTAPARRVVNFVSLRNSLSMCVLICEDLARPDPVADVVRSVGPNLVVALLMGGPQIEKRWAGRYASVLADDPGSSVLTVTSQGMCQLSKDGRFNDSSRKIAMWKDCRGGTQEIELQAGSQGILLTLYDHDNSFVGEEEVSADGRGDGGASGIWVYGGVHQLQRTTSTATKQKSP